MKLTGILLLTGLLQVHAGSIAQSVTYSAKAVPLTKVFAVIKQQTGYLFFYSPDDLRDTRPFTCEWKDLPLRAALDNLFAAQPLNFEIQGNTVVISKAEKISAAKFPAPPTNDIHGRVTDSLGNPLAGASIIVKGSKIGTTTDVRGMFELKNISDDATLVISYTGYESGLTTLQGRTTLVIALSHNNNPLDEAQVIAYGNTTERLNTGNVTTIRSKDIENQPVSNPLQALEGRVPGLLISQVTGLPGSGINVQIQGQNSIVNGNDPFYVVDGVPYTSQFLPNLGGVLGVGSGNNQQNGSPLSLLSPSDIESISVLKDADATAIYGSRAANGAILITTRKGKAGKTVLNLNLQTGAGAIAHKLSLLNTPQYLQMRHEAIANDGMQPDPTYDFDLTLWDTTRYTNWQKALIGGTAQYDNLNATVSGGNTNTQYLIGGTFHRETTVMPGNFADQKGSLHFSIRSASADQRFNLQFSGSYLIDNNRLPPDDLTRAALETAPDAPALHNPDGSLNWAPPAPGAFGSWSNPLSGLNSVYHSQTTNLISNLLLSYQVLKDLEIRSSFGYTNQQTNEYALYPATGADPAIDALYGDNIRFGQYGNSRINSWIIEPQAVYKQSIGNGKLEALVGTTIQQNNSNGSQLNGFGFTSDAVMQDMQSAATLAVNADNIVVYKYNALFGRMGYNWKEEFLINLTGRRDGSSRFGSANQFHDFGAVGLGWIFTKELLFQQALPWLSFGKIRLSYGTTGSDQIGDYKYLTLYNNAYAPVPYQGITSLTPAGLSNPYLQWEETKKFNAGLDLGLFKDRLLVNANYFINRSSNELLGYALPIITGFSGISRNFPATVRNTGIELSFVSTNIKTKDFSWTTNINLTIPRNKLASFPNLANSLQASNLVIGKPLDVRKLYRSLGVDSATGEYQVADAQGKPTTTPNPITDATMLISLNPKFYGGFENAFSYKGFRLDVLFQFVNQLAPNDYFGAFLPGVFNTNQPTSVLSRWQKAGDVTTIERYNSNYALGSSYNNALATEKAYQHGSYIRCKNLQLSWELPAGWKRAAHFSMAQIYLSGQDLFTITRYQGLDPETQSFFALPPLRVLSCGIQLGL